MRFAITGVGGFVAPRHLKAIREVGGTIVAAVDDKDSVGILDSHAPEAAFHTRIETFAWELDRLRGDARVGWLAVCSPNDLHAAHARIGLGLGADVICEKPLVTRLDDLDRLQELEGETGHRVWTILQLRVHPKLIALRERLMEAGSGRRQVELTYVTRRGPWYQTSWKGDPRRSGGVALNIGIHFFDLLAWFFGPVGEVRSHLHGPTRAAGSIAHERADVRWFLSLERDDLPESVREKGGAAYRSMTIDGEEVEFSDVFHDLHTEVYRRTLRGEGFGLSDARPAIELVSRWREAPVVRDAADRMHPKVAGG